MKISPYLRERSCPLCGSTDKSRVLYPANFDESSLNDFAFASRKLPELMHLTLLECPGCRLVYASPALTEEFLAGAYSQAAYDSSQEADYAAATYAGELPRIVRRLGQPGAALEIGAGNGAFLAHLRKAGFSSITGVEPSSAAAAKAPPDIFPLIRLGMFRAEDFEPSSLSLLTCFQTLEHVENPRQLSEAAFRLLRPGGAVYFVAHDRQSLVNKMMGTKSPIFDIEHLQLFSRESMRYMLEAAGFTGIEVTTLRNRYPLSYWTRLMPVPAPLKKGLLSALSASGVGKVTVALNVGNLAAVGYRPA
jgi:SAM-dependent methyltransferase